MCLRSIINYWGNEKLKLWKFFKILLATCKLDLRRAVEKIWGRNQTSDVDIKASKIIEQKYL